MRPEVEVDHTHVDAEDEPVQDFDPPKRPYPKVEAAGAAGALAIVIAYVVSLLGVELPQTVVAALTTILTVGAAYIRAE